MSFGPAFRHGGWGSGGQLIKTVPFPFIVGCGRSGTTLVRAILDSHPDLAIPHESYFIGTLAPRRHRYEGRGGFDADLFVADLLKHPWFYRWELAEEDVRAVLTAEPPADYPDAIRRVFSLYTRQHGKARYGDKTPKYVAQIPLLAELFPEACFIHVIRDGRDVALSLMEQEWGSGNVSEAAIFWKKRAGIGRKAGLLLGPERYVEVRYEELVDDPERTVRSLCAFIDLGYERDMLRYFERADELVASAAFPHRHDRLFSPVIKGLRDWRRQMSSQQIATFEALAGDLLDDFGYERGSAEVGAGTRAAARLRYVAARAHRIFRRRGAVRRIKRLRRRWASGT
jgi:Sulfotransferase family